MPSVGLTTLLQVIANTMISCAILAFHSSRALQCRDRRVQVMHVFSGTSMRIGESSRTIENVTHAWDQCRPAELVRLKRLFSKLLSLLLLDAYELEFHVVEGLSGGRLDVRDFYCEVVFRGYQGNTSRAAGTAGCANLRQR